MSSQPARDAEAGLGSVYREFLDKVVENGNFESPGARRKDDGMIAKAIA
jgi:hypothetical protein